MDGGGLGQEDGPRARVAREVGPLGEGDGGLGRPAGPREELAADAREEMAAAQRTRGQQPVRDREPRLRIASPASGPSAIATATARFSATTGFGPSASSRV